MKKFVCPCCGYKTLEHQKGHYDLCPICAWEQDDVQESDPDYSGGANYSSLRQAQKNFKQFGASDRIHLGIVRKPTKKDIRDNKWKPLE
jgi:anaerobic ribonucleoside-triphosphate reductase